MDASDLYAIEIRQHHHETCTSTFVEFPGAVPYLDDPALDELDETTIREVTSYGAAIIARVAATVAAMCGDQLDVVTDPEAPRGSRLVRRHVPWTVEVWRLVQPFDDGGDCPGLCIEHPHEDAGEVRVLVEDVLALVADSEARITTGAEPTWCLKCREPQRAEVNPAGRCPGCFARLHEPETEPPEEHGHRVPGDPVGAGERSLDIDLTNLE